MEFLAWIVIGGIAGWLGSIVMKTNESMGLVANIVVGVLGALIAGFLYSALLGGQSGITGFNFTSLIIAFVGSIILLAIIKAFRRGGSRV